MLQALIWLSFLLLNFTPIPADAAIDREQVMAKLEQNFRLGIENPQASIKASKELLDIIDADMEPELWLRVARQLASANNDLMEGEESKRFLDTSVARARALDNKEILANFLTLKGRSLLNEGANQEAVALFEEAIATAAKTTNKLSQSNAHSALGFALITLGQESAAAEQLNQAYDLLKDCPQDIAYFIGLLNLAAGFMQLDENQTTRPIEMLEPIVRFANKENLRILAKSAHFNLANNYEGEKKWDKALFNYRESARIARDMNDENGVAFASYGIGSVLLNLDQLPEAEIHLRRSLDYFENKSKAQSPIIHANFALLRLSLLQKNGAQADIFLKKIENNPGSKDMTDWKRELLESKASIFELKDDQRSAAKAYKDLADYYRDFIEKRDQELIRKYNALFDLNRREKDNKDLALQNERQAERLTASEKFRQVSMIALALSFGLVIFLLVVLRQSKEIKRSRLNMKRVLDNIDEAIIILDRKMMIKMGYSSQLEKIIGQDQSTLQSQNMIDFLFRKSRLSNDTISIIQSTLDACFGETDLAWELNSAQLPHDLPFGSRILELHWQPLFNKDNLIHELLISIRDVTEQRQLEETMAIETARTSRLQTLLQEMISRDYARSSRFLNASEASLKACEVALFENSDLSLAFRTLHTLKGSARSLGLQTLATAVHEMESMIVIQEQKLSDEQEAQGRWTKLLKAWNDYRSLIGETKASGPTHEDSAPKNLYQQASIFLLEAERRLEGLSFAGVFVNDAIQNWNPDALQTINGILFHALTNSIDHGFLFPSKDLKSLSPARIEIDAHRDADTVCLTISDNGAGLNMEKLKLRAQSMNFVPKAGETLADVVFLEGVSTADTTSETSGRGIGMSAVKAGCLELGGQIIISNRSEGGTILSMRIPAQRVCATANSPQAWSQVS